jgi:hypothetical protein
MTLGVAVIGAISGGTLAGAIGKSFATATHPGWWVTVGLGLLILVGGVISSSAWAEGTARRTAESFNPEAGPARGRGPGPITLSSGSRAGAGTAGGTR